MDEHKEEGEFVGNCEEPVKQAGEELGVPVSVNSETLGAKIEDCNGDANTVEGSDSGVCNSGDVGNETDEKTTGGENHGGDGSGLDTGARSLEEEARGKDNSASEEKTEKADVGRTVEMSGSVDAEATDAVAKAETESENVEHDDDSERAQKMVSSGEDGTEAVFVEPVNVRGNAKPCDDAERSEKTATVVEAEMTDDTATPEIERKNGEINESTEVEKTVSCVGSEVTDEKVECGVEVENGDAGDVGETEVVGAEESSDAAVIKGSEEKESVQRSEEDNEKMDVDNENKIRVVKDEEVGSLCDEQINPESETLDAKPSRSVQALEEPDQVTKGKVDVVVDGEEVEAQEGNACDSLKNSSAAEICLDEQTTDMNQKEEKVEAMEIDSVEEEQVKEVDKLGGVTEKVGKESADANTMETQDVPTGEAKQVDSNVESKIGTHTKYIEDQKDKDDTMGDVTDKIVSKDSTDPDNPIEDASTGEVEPMDHHVLFDPNSDIANYIDFSGVSSWSGNIQEMRTDSRNVSGEENTEVTDTAKEVTTVNGQEGLQPDIEEPVSVRNVQESVLDESKGKAATTNLESHDPNTVDEMEIDREGGDSENMSGAKGIEKESNERHIVSGAESPAAAADYPKETSDADLGSFVGEENREEKGSDEPKHTITEQEGDALEAPNVDPNQRQDTEMAERLEGSEHDEGTDSDSKTNGVKRKADVLGEDSSQEVRKTISVAKVTVSPSHPQRSSFKIGACIARAASQMAGPPSVLKGSAFSDDLSVDNFLSQLQSAATDPVKENVVSEIAAGFFLDYRNSVVSQQPPPDKMSGKRGRPSNHNIGGTEAFEFEEMSDTYWTDRVIHNGGEEQTPPTDKGGYQIVPVELKPAQIQRTRRPYTKRKHAENNNNNNNNSLSASGKPTGFDENAPAELIMSFSEMDTIPSEISLNKMFRHFGPIREFQTEVDRDTSRARVVFKKCADAEVAYNSAGRFSIFGTKVVNYELSYTITEPFKIQPYVVSLGEEDGSLCLPSQS